MKRNPRPPGIQHALYITTACAASILPLAAQRIIEESFAYPLGATGVDVDASSGQANGLPFQNIGGLPAGSGTGLRGNWGAATTVIVPGLSYPGLASSLNALQHTGSSWSDGPFPYRFMDPDPYLANRVGIVNNGNFGADGGTLYFSFLFKVADVSKQARLGIETTQANVFYGLNSVNSGGAFTLAYDPYDANPANLSGPITGPGATITNGATNLIVGRLVAGATSADPDEISLWVNPSLDAFDGSQPASLVSTVTSGTVNFFRYKFNSDTPNNLTFDELRLGTTLASVTPPPVAADTTAPEWIAGFPKMDSVTSSSFRLRTQTNETGKIYYVVLPDGAAAPTAAQVKLGQDSTGTSVSFGKSGNIPVTANVIANASFFFLDPSTQFDVYLVTEDFILNTSTPLLFNANTASTVGSLIINESFNYTVGTSNPDPDGGLNGGEGLPATNAGGVPAGTSTGIRGLWGADVNVVAGLTYPGLLTSGGAANATTATWGASTTFVYRNMANDPFSSLRLANSFGLDGQSLYFSMLAQTSSNTDSAWKLKITGDPDRNIFIKNTTEGWTIEDNGITASTGAALDLDTPTLLLVRIDFVEGIGEIYNLWKDPALDTDDLGAPDASITIGGSSIVFNRFQTRSSVAGAMIFDELRMGTSISSVLPSDVVSPTSNFASWATTNGVTGGLNGDSDNDGVLNSVEYALNTNLSGSDGSVGSFTGGLLSFSKRQAAIDNGDVTYVIETSPSLAAGSWTPQVTQAPGNTAGTIQYALPTGQGKLFGRLSILINP